MALPCRHRLDGTRFQRQSRQAQQRRFKLTHLLHTEPFDVNSRCGSAISILRIVRVGWISDLRQSRGERLSRADSGPCLSHHGTGRFDPYQPLGLVEMVVTGIERRGWLIDLPGCDQFGSFTLLHLNRPLIVLNCHPSRWRGPCPGLQGARQSSSPAFSSR
jgi:hypothetical protein